MARNTKTAKSSSHQSDKQHFWLSILLIITCVCLITAILMISFFIYREIDRTVKDFQNASKDRYDKLRSDYKTTIETRGISTPRILYGKTATPAFVAASTVAHSSVKDKLKNLNTTTESLLGKGSATAIIHTEKYDGIVFPGEADMLKSTKGAVIVSPRPQSNLTESTKLFPKTLVTHFKFAKLRDATTSYPTSSKSVKKRVYVKGGFLKRINETTSEPSSLDDTSRFDLNKSSGFYSGRKFGTTPLYTLTSTESLFSDYHHDIEPTISEVKTYYVKTVETIPTTIIKYIEKDPPPPIKVCETITCKRSISKMIALMDHNADPCEDFYSFACRGVEINRLKNPQYENVILDRLESIEPVDGNTAKFKQFYVSCMDFDKSEGLLALQTIVNDTFYMSDKGDKRDTLTKTVLKIIMLDSVKSYFQLLPMFDVAMELGADGSFIPTISVPSLKEHNKVNKECIKNLSTVDLLEKNVQSYYERYQTCIKDINVHVSEIQKILRKISTRLPVPESNEQILKILESMPRSVDKRVWSEYIAGAGKPVYFSIKDLHEKYPEINWAVLLMTLFKEKGSKVSSVRFMFKDHLDELFKYYRENSLKDLTLALRVIFIYDLYTSTIEEYDDSHKKEYCLSQARSLMEDLSVKLLLSKNNKKDLEQLDALATSIFHNIETQFKTSIQNSTWISDPMKTIILSKLEKMQLIADTNNLYFNEPLINYRNEKITFTNNYIENIVSLKKNKRSLIYNKIDNNPGNMWLYEYNPLSTQVWTVPDKETIVLPLGLLMKLAFKKRRAPQLYEMYAQLGFQIGRGVAMFFEPSRLKTLLPGIEENEFYKNYLHVRLGDPQIAKAINKYELMAIKEDLLLSQDSRFVDDLTIRLSFDTYNATAFSKDLQFLWLNYTIPQLFYLTAAQDYCKPEDSVAELALALYEESVLPNFFRVNSFLMNSIGFSDAYHCPLGSTLNPALKADAFPYITYTEIDYL